MLWRDSDGEIRPQNNEPSCIAGTYYFADLFGKVFSASERLAHGSGLFAPNAASGTWRCSASSPVACANDLGMIFSFFEDNLGQCRLCFRGCSLG